MALDDCNWRPITFEGVTFPVTVMAISVLDRILNLDPDDRLGDWLWRFPICKGVTKRAPAKDCEAFAGRAAE